MFLAGLPAAPTRAWCSSWWGGVHSATSGRCYCGTVAGEAQPQYTLPHTSTVPCITLGPVPRLGLMVESTWSVLEPASLSPRAWRLSETDIRPKRRQAASIHCISWRRTVGEGRAAPPPAGPAPPRQLEEPCSGWGGLPHWGLRDRGLD